MGRAVGFTLALAALIGLGLSRRARATTPDAPTGSKPPSAPVSIIVAKGDTLSSLAARHLGDQKLWPGLWDANRAVIGASPDLVQPGMVLVVPPSPTAARAAAWRARAVLHQQAWKEHLAAKRPGRPALPAAVTEATA